MESIGWLVTRLKHAGKPIWLLLDGAYANRAVLRAAKELLVTVVSRLRRDAALWTLPEVQRPKGKGGWTAEEVEIYGRVEEVTSNGIEGGFERPRPNGEIERPGRTAAGIGSVSGR